MTASFGKITAHLAEPIEQIPNELAALINQNIRPPEPVSASDIFVRAMYVVSDEINSFGGRFPADEHVRLAALLIDSPVLVGHRKDKLPIGRNFHTTHVTKDGRQWIKCFFYWLKSTEGAESLRENIDGGIYKECSIGFTYLFPECSVCGEDIRRCDHEPLNKIATGGKESTVHFNYRKIERVLETSLVYRGALPDTSVTKELHDSKNANPTFLKFLPIDVKRGAINYQLEQLENSDNAILRILDSEHSTNFVIRQFNVNRLRHGVRFLTEIHNKPLNTFSHSASNSNTRIIGCGEIVSVTNTNGRAVLQMSGVCDGGFILQPVRIQGEQRYLFYKNHNHVAELGHPEIATAPTKSRDLAMT